MQLKCSLCDSWLSLFQLSTLCPTCYSVRTIVKAYSAPQILDKLQSHFLIENTEIKKSSSLPNLIDTNTTDDTKDYDKPIKVGKIVTRNNKSNN